MCLGSEEDAILHPGVQNQVLIFPLRVFLRAWQLFAIALQPGREGNLNTVRHCYPPSSGAPMGQYPIICGLLLSQAGSANPHPDSRTTSRGKGWTIL